MPNTPIATYRDGLTIGKLSRQWGQDASFVRGLIEDGQLATDERGCATVASLRDFYRTNPHPMDR